MTDPIILPAGEQLVLEGEITLEQPDGTLVSLGSMGPITISAVAAVEPEPSPEPSPEPEPTPEPDAWWDVDLFEGADLAGSSVVSITADRLGFVWEIGELPPGISAKPFSLRAARTFVLPAGDHRITARADDGVRVRIDGGPWLINEWRPQAATTFTADFSLAEDRLVDIEVEYFDNGPKGRGELILTLENPRRTDP